MRPYTYPPYNAHFGRIVAFIAGICYALSGNWSSALLSLFGVVFTTYAIRKAHKQHDERQKQVP